MSATHDRFIEDLNEFLRKLVDDGCFDLANKFYDLLEEYDLLADESVDDYEDAESS